MKELLKKISRGMYAFLLAGCLLAAGCGVENTGQQKNIGADAEVSAFSIGKKDTGGDSDTTRTEELTVQFLDVGQGSAALIRQGGSSMLVDGGDREYSSYVVSFLKKQGIENLDYVIVSHYDSDHLSGIVGVLNAFHCRQVLAPDYEADTKIYQSFLNMIKEKEIPVTYPALGDTFFFADSSFRIVSPASYTYKDTNSNSIGIRLEYGENSFFIGGDGTEESEQDILYLGTDVKSDVYAANHHGSKYSNSPEFLEAVSPSYVVVSSGKGNSYGHPDAPVMLAIQSLGTDLYRTDLQGVITAVSDGESIQFENEVCMDYRSGIEIAEAGGAGNGGTDSEKDMGESNTPDEVESSETAEYQYIVNMNTKKFHLPFCSSVADMEEKNKEYSGESREQLVAEGYSPCKRCNP